MTSAQDPSNTPGREPAITIVNVSSHCDWSWTHTRAWHEERYAEIIHNVLLIMRENPNYVWLLETESDELAPFLEKARREWPGLETEFWQRVREGRIEVICGTSNPRLTEVYPETIIRNLVMGKEYFRAHAPGIRQESYNSVDLMCGPSQMPQILTQAGYRYFMFSRPYGKQIAFWRQGLDGTRMLSSLGIYGYGEMETSRYDTTEPGFPHAPVWRIAIGEDDGLPDPALPKQAATWDPNKKVLSTLTRYFEELEKYGGGLAEREGPLDSLEDFIESGMHGNRSIYALNNQDEDLLLTVEKAQAMASLIGDRGSKKEIDQLWHDVIGMSGHAIQWAWKDDYEGLLRKAHARRESGESLRERILSTIANEIPARGGSSDRLIVFNFQSWPVTGPVECVLDSDPASLVLKDDAGHSIPLQSAGPAPGGGYTVAFVADRVPACGYRTYHIEHPKSQRNASPQLAVGYGPIENEHYRASLNANGSLEVVDKKREVPLGGLGDIVFYDMPIPPDWFTTGPLEPRHDWTSLASQCESITGPVYSALRAEGTFGSHTATRELRLWHGSKRLDYRVTIDAVEGCGVFCIRFPIGMSKSVTAGIPFGAEPRDHLDQEPFRGETWVLGYPEGFQATRWADVSDGQRGYTFTCPPGMHTGYLFRRSEQALEFILLQVRPDPPGFWAQMDPSIKGGGHHEWRCALTPHDGGWQEAATYRDALETHVPLLAYQSSTDATGHSLPQAASFCDVSPKSVVLSSLRPVEASHATWELRLYEAAGHSADAVIRLPRSVGKVTETSFLGEPTAAPAKITIHDKEIRLRIQPWKIVTLHVELNDGD